MPNEFTQFCADQFATKVEELFEANRKLPGVFADIPLIGGRYLVRCQSTIPELVHQVCCGLAAELWFQKHGPDWVNPLPLRMAECEALTCDEDHTQNLRGYFGISLRWTKWDFELHPTPDVFASGVMASVHAPDDIRSDPELLMLFPPHPLAGLDTNLSWNTPEEIAEIAAGEARQRQEWLDMGRSLAEVRAEFGY